VDTRTGFRLRLISAIVLTALLVAVLIYTAANAAPVYH
jgi:hypothetical protein